MKHSGLRQSKSCKAGVRPAGQLGRYVRPCTFKAKKMILAQFIKAVYVRRDYEIEFNVSFEEFQNLYLARDEVAVLSE